MTDHDIARAARLWLASHDTHAIARALQLREADVVRHLLRINAEAKTLRNEHCALTGNPTR